MRTFVTFTAKFSDDGIWIESGDTLTPDGKGIATAIRDTFHDGGYDSSQVEQHSDYGWAFTVRSCQVKVWFLLQYPGHWLLLSERKKWPLPFLSRKHEHLAILLFLNEKLASDKRFQNVRWFTGEEYKRRPLPPGSQTP